MPSSVPHPFDGIDLRTSPEHYRIGRGEYGVFHAEPYKSELLPHWRFRTPALAQASAEALYERFTQYRTDGDFVGMDLARKFLQMGYTRARRYARYAGGRKYDAAGRPRPLDPPDPDKAAAAGIFHAFWTRVREDPVYQRLKQAFQERQRTRS